eukprot:TRINITY_DN58402_c0_g1_i2.p1 TRINITY_DN58402_c0_g1~~TRINITY_DN58402_c0_g1_i2.p1  ORF type:complete len:151 (+),score=24.17 TRINITY_DN58402_c0_g1_i2:115-567(+)
MVRDEAPDLASIPLPAFVGQPAAEEIPSGQQEEDVAAPRRAAERLELSLERCADILRSSAPMEVGSLLRDLATNLLAERSRTLKLTALAWQLSEASNAFLRAKKVGLKAVLLCHSDHFRIEGSCRRQSATYLHNTIQSEWNISYQASINL